MLLSYGTQELRTKIAPHILTVRQDYFLAMKSVPLVSLVDHYGIPGRAIGNALKEVFYCPDTTAPKVRRTLPLYALHDLDSVSITTTNEPWGFYMQGDEIVILPSPTNPSATAALQLYHFRRPSELAPTTSCAKITAVSTVGVTTTLTVDTDLTASLSVGSTIDVICKDSPFLSWADDLAITAITATTISVAAASVKNEAGTVTPGVGDYLCPAGYTNLPQVPPEFHPILSEMIAARALKALGATEKLGAVQANIKEMLLYAFKMIANRVESETEVLYNKNSLVNSLRQSRFGR